MNKQIFLERRQRGATLPLVLFLLTGLLGAAALAIDLSMMDAARQRAQVVADAAALAGAASPASAASAAAAGSVIAANNAVGSAFTGATVTTAASGAVTVHGSVNAPLSFAPAVGYAPTGADGSANTLTVSASATAAMSAACSLPVGMPVAPFGVIGDDPTNTDPAVAFVSALLSGTKTLTPGAYQAASTQLFLRINLWDTAGNLRASGSFDPLLISGVGADYRSTIGQMSNQPLSAGQVFSTLPLIYDSMALTRAGIAARLAPSNTQFKNISYPVVTYDTWFNGSQPQNDGHLMLIPIISQAVKNKPGNVSIIAFATFFISQVPTSQDTSNSIVFGRFLSVIVPGASGGACTSAGTLTPPHLTL